MSGKYQTYHEYKDSGVEMLGALPTSWQTKQVRYLLKDGAEGIKIGPFGSALKLEDMVDYGTRVYGQENVIKKDFTLGKRRISQDKFEEMQVYKVYADDLLITMMGTSGKCILVPEDAEVGIIDSHLLRMRVKETEILPKYFRLLIDECYEIENQIKISGKGSIMHGLNSSIVKSLTLPLPSLTEQGKILNFLDHETAKIDILIEKQQQLIKLLKEKCEAVISHAVTKGLNPSNPMRDSGVEWLGEVPKHWDVKRLKFTCEFVTQKTDIGNKKTIALENIESGSGKYVATDSIYTGEDVGFKSGDVLFGKLRPYLAKVYFAEDGGVAFGDLLVYRPKGNLLGKYCFYQMINEAFIKTVDSSTYGSKMPRASADFINDMEVSLPPIREQEEIVTYIDTVLAKFDDIEVKAKSVIRLMQERRTALISAAITGKIDVRNWKASEEVITQ